VVPVIAPYADSREAVRKRHEASGTPYVEVHVATPVEVREGPGQGTRLLAARRVLPVGPTPPAPRTVAALQRPPRPRRTRPCLPPLQLDRTGRLAVHRPRRHRTARDLLRARARGLPAVEHVADRR
jgi:hypothetical protein